MLKLQQVIHSRQVSCHHREYLWGKEKGVLHAACIWNTELGNLDHSPLLKNTNALNGCPGRWHPRSGHKILETPRASLQPRTVSGMKSTPNTINSVPISVFLKLLSLIFKPLKPEEETPWVPHLDTRTALHNKAMVINRHFLHNFFWAVLSP